ncbi:MAG: hypothetical protein QM775_09475 [Pirellulales bacterium]
MKDLEREPDKSPDGIPPADQVRDRLIDNRRERLYLQRLLKLAELLKSRTAAGEAAPNRGVAE